MKTTHTHLHRCFHTITPHAWCLRSAIHCTNVNTRPHLFFTHTLYVICFVPRFLTYSVNTLVLQDDSAFAARYIGTMTNARAGTPGCTRHALPGRDVATLSGITAGDETCYAPFCYRSLRMLFVPLCFAALPRPLCRASLRRSETAHLVRASAFLPRFHYACTLV